MFDAARQELKAQKTIPISNLVEGYYYHLLAVKCMDTKFGQAVQAKLEGGVSVWLPKGFTKHLDLVQLASVTAEDNWEIAYLGKEGDGSYKFINIDIRKKELTI
ncbi:hypothetical protein DMENIID0001_114940 [Sergentomyia squamirostris]